MRKKKTYSHLSLYEREQIFVYKRQGKTLAEIGRLLSRHHTTISRELNRNSQPHEMMRLFRYFCSQTSKRKKKTSRQEAAAKR